MRGVQGNEPCLLLLAPARRLQQGGQAGGQAHVVQRAVEQQGVVELHLRWQTGAACGQAVEHGHTASRLGAAEPGVGHGIQQFGVVACRLLGLGQQGLCVGRVTAGTGPCDQRLDRGALRQRPHGIGLLGGGYLGQVGEGTQVVVHGRTDQGACVVHGAAIRAGRGGTRDALVHHAQRLARQVQPQVQAGQAVAQPGIARREHDGRLQRAHGCAQALGLHVPVGLFHQDVGLRAHQLLAQGRVAGRGLFQQRQGFARAVCACVEPSQALEGRAAVGFGFERALVQRLGLGASALQVADAGQCGQCLGIVRLHGQGPAREVGGRGQFVLLQRHVGLAQVAPEPGRGLQVLPLALAGECEGLAEQVLGLSMLALAQADHAQVTQALAIAGAQREHGL